MDLFAPPVPEQRIAHVYPTKDGRVVTFDQHNEVMAEFTGRWDELEDAIVQAMPPGAVIHGVTS